MMGSLSRAGHAKPVRAVRRGTGSGLLPALAALMWSVSLPGQSQTSAPQPDREALAGIARFAVDVMARGCTPNLGKLDGLERFARANAFAPARSEVQLMFQGFGPGAAWVLQRAGTDMAMLWTPDAHQCRVLARTADIETAQVYFRGVMEGVHTPQVSIRKLVDRDMEQAGRTYRQIGYVLQNEADSQGAARAFILTTFPAPDSPFAVIATVAATQRQ